MDVGNWNVGALMFKSERNVRWQRKSKMHPTCRAALTHAAPRAFQSTFASQRERKKIKENFPLRRIAGKDQMYIECHLKGLSMAWWELRQMRKCRKENIFHSTHPFDFRRVSDFMHHKHHINSRINYRWSKISRSALKIYNKLFQSSSISLREGA